MRLTLAITAVAITFASAVSGCSSDSGSAIGQDSVPFPAVNAEVDSTLVRSLVFMSDDVTEEYVPPEAPSDAINAIAIPTPRDAASACAPLIDADIADPHRSAIAAGETYEKNAGTPFAGYITSRAELLAAPSDVANVLGIYNNTNNDLCLRRMFEPLWRAFIPVGADTSGVGTDLNLVRIADLSSPRSVGLRLVGTAPVSRQVANLYLDVLVTANDRGLTYILLAAYGSEPSPDGEIALVTTANEKAAAAAHPE